MAIVVEQHGQVVWSRQLQPGSHRGRGIDPSLHDIRSAGKSLTALAVGAALADGHLPSLDERVWPLLGRPAEGPHGDVTVRDLLTMASDLACDDRAGRRSPGWEERMYRHRSWRDFALDLPGDPTFTRDARGQGRFAYCTAGVFLLGQVVETVTGTRFDDYVQQRLFDPMGIDDVVWRRSRSGEVQSGGQLQMSARDLARVGRLVLDRGQVGDEQVLPGSWLEEMLTPAHVFGTSGGYGYLWWASWVPTASGPVPAWHMMGNGGTLVALFRPHDLVVVVQARAFGDPDARRRSLDLVGAALDGLDPLPPPDLGQTTDELLAPFQGRWEGEAYRSRAPADRWAVALDWQVRPRGDAHGVYVGAATWAEIPVEMVGIGTVDGLPVMTHFDAVVRTDGSPLDLLSPARCSRVRQPGPSPTARTALVLDPTLAERIAPGADPRLADADLLHPCESSVGVLFGGLTETVFATIHPAADVSSTSPSSPPSNSANDKAPSQSPPP